VAPKKRNANNGQVDGGKGKRLAIIACGLLVFCVGLVLVLQNYSNHAFKFNLGFVLVLISAGTIIWAAAKTDRRRPNGNSHPRRP
jgi:hypothetical protein